MVRARIVEWRGPSPYFFVPIEGESADQIRELGRRQSYGWGVVPVHATLGKVTWSTSLIPRELNYFLPIRDQIRKVAGVTLGDEVTVTVKFGS